MLTKILLGFGVLSNLATLLGFWMNYISSPESVQNKVSRLLLIGGAAASILLYLGVAYLIFRKHPKTANAKSALEAFRNPQWETVIRRDFKNESVDLDGKRFWDCTFNHVTVAFHGTGPVEFMGACNFAPNMILSTDCPAAMEYAKLIEIFSSIPNTRVQHVGVDKDGKPLPRTFQIKEVTRPSPDSPGSRKGD